jgi:hypothetical protein
VVKSLAKAKPQSPLMTEKFEQSFVWWRFCFGKTAGK